MGRQILKIHSNFIGLDPCFQYKRIHLTLLQTTTTLPSLLYFLHHVKTRLILWTFYLLKVHFKEILLENNFLLENYYFGLKYFGLYIKYMLCTMVNITGHKNKTVKWS